MLRFLDLRVMVELATVRLRKHEPTTIFAPIEIAIWVWDFQKWIQMKKEAMCWVSRGLEEGCGTADGEKKKRKRTKEEDDEQEIES